MLTDKKMNNELLNKVKYLYQALNQCERIVSSLEQENNYLKETCKNIEQIQKKDSLDEEKI